MRRRTRDEGRGTRDEGRGTRDEGTRDESSVVLAKRSSVVYRSIVLAMLFIIAAQATHADPDKAAFVSKVIYRTDDLGDYKFDEIKASSSYEFTTPHKTSGAVYSITCNYTFTGEVTMEVSATGNAKDYIPVVNGVPLEVQLSSLRMSSLRKQGSNDMFFTPGKNIIWRATLGANSTLTEAAITYMDDSGVVGTFGNPALSGFMFRKPIYIRGQGTGYRVQEKLNPEPGTLNPERGAAYLFNYQLPIKIGESSKAEDCDVRLKGVIQADFADVRFTLADQETLIPHYLESVKGEFPNRTALFYVRIPVITRDEGRLSAEALAKAEGTRDEANTVIASPARGGTKQSLLYLYYGNADAVDLSSGEEVFDFFDDFNNDELDTDIWDSALDTELSSIEVFDSELRLDGAKVTTKSYKFANGIIEYRARSTAAAIEGIVGQEYVCYSSTYPGAEHAIALVSSVKANEAKAITLDKYYNYRITNDGENLTFQRYDEAGNLETETSYEDSSLRAAEGGPRESGEAISSIGLYATADGTGSYYDYIRVRKYAATPPQVDLDKTATAQEEAPNIAEFNGVTIAANGDLVMGDGETEGEYISPLINAPFKTRIIIPTWDEGRVVHRNKAISIDISAEEYATYKQDCESGAYYYASRKDFTEGDKLRWRARLRETRDERRGTWDEGRIVRRPSEQSERSSIVHRNEAFALQRFTLDFRPGTITVVKPNGGEKLELGKQYPVCWDATQYDSKYKLNLAYSLDGGKAYTAIAEGVSNSGQYPWSVPRETRDEGRETRDEGRETRDEGRGTRDEGRGTRDEGRRTKGRGTSVVLASKASGRPSSIVTSVSSASPILSTRTFTTSRTITSPSALRRLWRL